MKNVYRIEFQVDNGITFVNDMAIVTAENKDEAVKKLSEFINNINSETCISKIYKVTIFEGEIFTRHHKYQ